MLVVVAAGLPELDIGMNEAVGLCVAAVVVTVFSDERDVMPLEEDALPAAGFGFWVQTPLPEPSLHE